MATAVKNGDYTYAVFTLGSIAWAAACGDFFAWYVIVSSLAVPLIYLAQCLRGSTRVILVTRGGKPVGLICVRVELAVVDNAAAAAAPPLNDMHVLFVAAHHSTPGVGATLVLTIAEWAAASSCVLKVQSLPMRVGMWRDWGFSGAKRTTDGCTVMRGSTPDVSAACRLLMERKGADLPPAQLQELLTALGAAPIPTLTYKAATEEWGTLYPQTWLDAELSRTGGMLDTDLEFIMWAHVERSKLVDSKTNSFSAAFDDAAGAVDGYFYRQDKPVGALLGDIMEAWRGWRRNAAAPNPNERAPVAIAALLAAAGPHLAWFARWWADHRTVRTDRAKAAAQKEKTAEAAKLSVLNSKRERAVSLLGRESAASPPGLGDGQKRQKRGQSHKKAARQGGSKLNRPPRPPPSPQSSPLLTASPSAASPGPLSEGGAVAAALEGGSGEGVAMALGVEGGEQEGGVPAAAAAMAAPNPVSTAILVVQLNNIRRHKAALARKVAALLKEQVATTKSEDQLWGELKARLEGM